MARMAHDGAMPIKDDETRREYMRRYYARYLKEHRRAIRKRQARWFQDNKERIIPKQRRQRRQARRQDAIAVVLGLKRRLERAA